MILSEKKDKYFPKQKVMKLLCQITDAKNSANTDQRFQSEKYLFDISIIVADKFTSHLKNE